MCVLESTGFLERFLSFSAKSGVSRGNIQIISAALRLLWHWSLHSLQVASFGIELGDGGWRDTYCYVSEGMCMHIGACVCVRAGGCVTSLLQVWGTEGVCSAATVHQKMSRGKDEERKMAKRRMCRRSVCHCGAGAAE